MQVIKGFEAGKEALDRGSLRVWDSASPEVLDRIEKLFNERLTPREVVARILDSVRWRGDSAVLGYTSMLDGVDVESLEVPKAALKQAYDAIPADLRKAMETAAARVRSFQQACMPKSWIDEATGLGEQFTPMARAGVYAPGGLAAYPSTVLMTAIPAKVAGVDEVILATPSGRDSSGPNPTVLAAAYIAGVDRVFQMGGAQAIAAMAYGTESVPKVDIVCGPGNIFVTLAKQMVYGEVAVDGLYGPTETLVIADGSADPVLCAADLLAQAEHDALASPVFITTSETVLAQVAAELARQLEMLPKRDIAAAALEGQGVLVLVDNLDEAIALGNLYSPEHMCLLVEEPRKLMTKVRNAGGVFLGESSPEVAGDYIAGPSHVMPTGGTARFNSSLGVHQFLKVTSVIGLDSETFHALGEDAARFAEAEGLDGHARAAQIRLERSKGGGL
jgi:histidinol dehydrogenase